MSNLFKGTARENRVRTLLISRTSQDNKIQTRRAMHGGLGASKFMEGISESNPLRLLFMELVSGHFDHDIGLRDRQ